MNVVDIHDPAPGMYRRVIDGLENPEGWPLFAPCVESVENCVDVE